MGAAAYGNMQDLLREVHSGLQARSGIKVVGEKDIQEGPISFGSVLFLAYLHRYPYLIVTLARC